MEVAEDCCVKVAVHARPLIVDEKLQGCKDCLTEFGIGITFESDLRNLQRRLAFLPSSLLLSYLLSLSATSPGLVALSHFEMRMSGGVVGDAVDESRTWKCG
ncbi:hypothetical protein VIGAN_10134800 [Vigna angularis var. angularis]|uniref:Uncharacterized protein n=1 Tax=Vigna angularis var. angularis TaxID=157739 RepID=A0A0S3T4H6_PHAAN|nr:hypothetical protein VIGAN_10134800 [Vigna angularis var. angularis]